MRLNVRHNIAANTGSIFTYVIPLNILGFSEVWAINTSADAVADQEYSGMEQTTNIDKKASNNNCCQSSFTTFRIPAPLSIYEVVLLVPAGHQQKYNGLLVGLYQFLQLHQSLDLLCQLNYQH